jgi:serine/threonine-protein kinase
MIDPDQDSPQGVAGRADATQMRDWFDALIDAPAASREAWLDAHVSHPADRAALRALLDADAAAGLLDEPAEQRAERIGTLPEPNADLLIGRRFGAFRATQVIGRGGMSVVYLGERDDGPVAQRAAIKVLRRGMYSAVEQGLFRREQKALASLSHPDIAYLIDGGFTEAGLPFLVLEYVDGRAVTEHADSSALALRERLTLFVSICRAVAAAHRQLIVHRDLKPSNILVTAEGRVKLLDFGIAKLLDDDAELPTRTGYGALTPEYAAPEQLHGEPVTTSTDVYALGVLLHELLTGQRPASDGATLRRPSSVRFESARDAASTASHAATRVAPAELRGDLDNILLMALAAEPERRYRSAAELGDDLQRHLDGRPVFAHPPSRWYRTRKFLVRHRGGVAVGAVALTAILASAAITAWQAVIAQREAVRANLVRDFVVEVFESARTSLPRDQRPTPEALVEQAGARLTAMPAVDTATRIDLLRTLASVWLSLSKFDAADAALGEALALATARGDAKSAREIALTRAVGWQRSGRNAEASTVFAEAIPALERATSPLLTQALSAHAEALLALGRADEAIATSSRAVAAAARASGEDSLEHLAARLEHGALLAGMERHPEAVAILDPALDQWRARGGPDDDRYLRGLQALAASSRALGTLTDAEGMYRDLLALHRRLYTAPHDAIAGALRSLATALADVERNAEAFALLDEALAMQRAVLAPDHVEQVVTLDRRGVIHAKLRDFAAAETAYAEAAAICERAALADEACSRVHNNRGQNFYRQGRLVEAEQQMRLALAQRRQRFGDDHLTVAVSLSTLGNVIERAGRHDEAVAMQREALATMNRLGMADTRDYALIRFSLALALQAAGEHTAALETNDAALALWRAKVPDGRSRELTMLVLKIQILTALDRTDAAREVAEVAIALDVDPSRIPPREKDVLRAASGRPALYP